MADPARSFFVIRIARATAVVAAILMVVNPVEAQPQTGIAAVDSAAVARAAFGRARAAMQTDNLATARAEMEHAAAAWPGQPAYTWALAQLVAAQNDTAALLRVLDRYAALGLGRDVAGNAQLRGYAGLPAFAAAVAAHERHRSPFNAGRTLFTLPDSTFYPEGLAYNPRTRSFFVTSVRHRTIAEVGPAGRVREVLPRGQSNLGAMLGVAVDAGGRALWATTSGIPQMAGYGEADAALATLLRIDIETGTIEKSWALPPAGVPKVLGDVVSGADGRIYISDSRNPVLYAFDPMRETFETITSPLFRSLQGIAPTDDANVLYVADYSYGLLRANPASGQVVRVEDAPSTTSLGCDGIAWEAGSVICVQNGNAPARVVRFDLSEDGGRITNVVLLDRNLPIADEPTVGKVVAGRFVYVANSQWEKYDDNGALKHGAVLTRPVLLSVPVR
jgi:sugar lactone lactonase YvrE